MRPRFFKNKKKLNNSSEPEASKSTHPSIILQTIFAGFLVIVAFMQWCTTDRQAIIMDKQKDIMDKQTTILDQQKELMRKQNDYSQDLGKSQLNLAEEQNKLLETQTEIAKEPIVDIFFENDIFEKYYSLIIANNGTSRIVDVIIQKELNGYDIQTLSASRLFNLNVWKKIKEVKPGYLERTVIPSEDFDKAWYGARFGFSSDSLAEIRKRRFPALLFKISYKRMGDKREYRVKKYLFLIKGLVGGKIEISGYDPDQRFTESISDQLIYDKIKEFEKNEPWIRGRDWFMKKN